jgi:serine protease Do
VARLVRPIAVVLVTAAIAAAVATFVYTRLRPTTIEGRGAPSGPVVAGNVSAVQKAAASLVRVETGSAPSIAPGEPARDAPGGSGVVVDSHGFVLTAGAVIAGAARVEVSVPGAKVYDARIVGSDPITGLSLLKIDATDLKAIDLAGDAVLQPGSGVVVVSAPPGPQAALGGIAGVSVSVSVDDPARPGRRRVMNDLVAVDLTQRESALGAAVVDGSGRMVAMVVDTAGGAWAVAASDAQPALQQLIESGRVNYPSLGLDYQQLSPSQSADRGITGGALVLAVPAGSAADQAGIIAGDVVTAINGTRLDSAHSLRRLLRDLPAGQAVNVSLKSATGSVRTAAVSLTRGPA